MAVTREQLFEIDTDEIFDWDAKKLDATLKALGRNVGATWKRGKKEVELFNLIMEMSLY